MIAVTTTHQYILLRHAAYHISRLRYELCVRRLECLQEQFIALVESFDLLGHEQSDVEDIWKEANRLIVADARFVLFSGPQAYQELESGWDAWFSRLVGRLDTIRQYDRHAPDASGQLEMVQAFIAAQSQQRAYIVRLSMRLLQRLYVDVPYRLRVGDINGACRVSANVLNTVGNAISSPFSTLNTTRR